MNKHQVWFRFYEELNDFLPPAKRKISFPFMSEMNQSVKDAIEAQGVPHTDIDMILVNGKQVDFSYRTCEGDRISVYPMFETLDITGATPLRPKPLRESKFVLDVHLGKLAKYLRVCGFDTLFYRDCSDSEIINIALNDKRIILTRDKGLLKNKKVTHGYWIRSQHPEVQLEEVIKRFDLKSSFVSFSRCVECNSMLKEIPKEEIINKIEPRTRQYYDSYKRCPQCEKIFWEGSHFERMKALLDKILKKL